MDSFPAARPDHRILITDAIMHGMPPHIAQLVAGHRGRVLRSKSPEMVRQEISILINPKITGTRRQKLINQVRAGHQVPADAAIPQSAA